MAPPLPTKATGRSGLDTTVESELGHQSTLGSQSAVDLYAPGGDPYAIPPMPGNNPNVPYHDDPYAPQPSAYYDPYRGPVPPSIDPIGGEHIPMTQMQAPGRTFSPAPGSMMYEASARTASPAPMGMGMVPGPGAMYGGGYAEGRMSPAPGSMNMGRRSPGPGPAYDGL